MLVAASRVASTKGIDVLYPVQELRALEVHSQGFKLAKIEKYSSQCSLEAHAHG